MNSPSLFRHTPLKSPTALQAPWIKACSEISTSTPNTTVEVPKHLKAFKYKGCRGVEEKSAHQPQKMPVGVAAARTRLYCLTVAANSATGFCSPIKQKAHKRHRPKAGDFFMPATSFYGGCAWGAFERAGFLLPRSANLRTAATQSCFAAGSGGSSAKGALPMTALIPPKIRAIAHRRMALSALRANSSLSVRLKRYNDHMAIVRSLEVGGFQ